MMQDELIILLIVRESLIEGDASSTRQKDLAAMLDSVISDRLTKRAIEMARRLAGEAECKQECHYAHPYGYLTD